MKILKVLSVLALIALMFNCSRTDDFVNESDQLQSTLKSADVAQGYIVVLNDETINESDLSSRKNAVKGRALGLLKKADVDESAIEYVYGKALQGFAVKLAPGQLKKLQAEGAVKHIEEDKIITLAPGGSHGKPTGGSSTPPPQTVPWGINRVGGGITASGVAWIIDTGIDLDHPDLNVDVNRSVVFLTGKKVTPDDQNGHGTHVSGTIAAIDNNIGVVGVAAGATVVSVRVLDRRGSGSLSSVIAGIDYVAANGSPGDVANMSLGGGISTTLDDAVYNASLTGVRFVLAAGNESADATTTSPARVNGTNVYTISAMDNNDQFAYFSNYGSPVDFCAPGVGVYSTYKDGGYETLSGTSMAAPHVAGLLLLGSIHADGYVSGDPDGNPDPIAHH